MNNCCILDLVKETTPLSQFAKIYFVSPVFNRGFVGGEREVSCCYATNISSAP